MIRRSVILIRGTVSRTEKRVSSKRKGSFNSKANFIQNTLDKARWGSIKSITVNSWEKFDLSDSLPARSNCGTELWKESLRGMTDWKCITIAGRKGRNHVLAVCSGLMKSDRWSTSISIVSLKLLKVELVRVVLASNLAQHFLVVVITQCPTKRLVGHVPSAIPVSPHVCRLFRAYDSELPVYPLPGHNWREPKIGQHVENELEQLGPGFQHFVHQSFEVIDIKS